ncbi:uncharacterized protein LOC127079947 [Lathyrus oleraceus]|uniref:uncharacterized protein LOC127079947 n=1 Tax=Pisum sativum TaxID=3888 RepID=UPI0021D267E8|nr:uncharacterized protein LOC127079947 [Pisum sativum]
MCMVCILLEQVDVILGINWLELNQVFTNCFDKLVQCAAHCKCSDDDIYDLPLEREFEFDRGEELTFVSAKKVREYVKDMEQLFVILASLEARGQGVVRDLPGVCEFREVFPEDIIDLPPERKVDFSIDLVPGISPVSMTPYMVSTLELGN